MNPHHKKEYAFLKSVAGYTLIEAIIALALVLATLAVFGAVVSTAPLTKTARNQNVAYHIAAKKIEELRNTPFASLPASGAFSDPGFSELASSTASLTLSNYQGSSLIKQATVSVNWWENQKQKTVLLDTLISNQGLNQP